MENKRDTARKLAREAEAARQEAIKQNEIKRQRDVQFYQIAINLKPDPECSHVMRCCVNQKEFCNGCFSPQEDD